MAKLPEMLRAQQNYLCDRAADEIERLEREIRRLEREVEKMRPVDPFQGQSS